MLTLMLLMRQKLAQEGKAGISLQDKEILDNTSWDELLRRNREALYRQLGRRYGTDFPIYSKQWSSRGCCGGGYGAYADPRNGQRGGG